MMSALFGRCCAHSNGVVKEQVSVGSEFILTEKTASSNGQKFSPCMRGEIKRGVSRTFRFVNYSINRQITHLLDLS
jgi:hypothetical protein